MCTIALWLLMLCIIGAAMGQTNCTDGDVHLVGGTSPLNGRVEVCYNNQWGGVCSTYPWSQNLAYAVCRQLGYRYDAVASYSNSSSYDPAISTFLIVYDCDAHANQLLSCDNGNGFHSTLGYYSCLGFIVSVNCTQPIPEYCSGTCTNGAIRLVGGTSPYKGRVEVCVEGCWGTVCGNGFDASDASVVCRQLGFQSLGATPIFNAYYGKGSGPIWQYSLSCTGNESSLFDCPHSGHSYYDYFYLYYPYYPYYYYYNQQYDYDGCDHRSDVGVHCTERTSTCSTGDVRLVNGSTPMEGRVEVCIGQQWGVVCGDYLWTSDTSGASIVCEQLGYSPSNATAYGNSYFGSAISELFLLNIHCHARAGRLVDCNYMYQSDRHYCYQGYTAGVLCQGMSTNVCMNGTVRLVGGSTPYEGRVEVCAHGTWGTVCSYNWDIRDASVVCGQLGYKTAVALSNQYGRGTGPVWLNNPNCVGIEQRLIDCPVTTSISNDDFYCSHYDDATVLCTATMQNCTDWDIRLVGGSSPLQGRVEVCYLNQWRTIYGNGGIQTFANVICKQLGFSFFNPTVYFSSHFGIGSGGIYLHTSTLFCTGNETRLQDCYHSLLGYNPYFYDYYNDIGLECQANTIGQTYTPCGSGTFRLVGGSVPSEGRVEICLGGNWSTISGNPSPWDQGQAAVICRQLGFEPSGAELVFSGVFGQGSGLSILHDALCMGNEASFLQCPWKYYYIGNDHTNDIGVRCAPASSSQCVDGDIRLVNGTNGTIGPGIIEGEVQVCYAGRWGMVTSSTWTLREASVVCRQLHYAPVALKAIKYPRNYPITRNITFSQFGCIGYEKKILDCYHGPPGYDDYYSNYNVAVRCQASCNQCQNGIIQLVGGNSSYEGRVEVCEGGCWGPVCIGDSGWSSLDAAVVCKQLQMGFHGAVPRYYYSLTSPPILAPHCKGNESSLFSCAQSVCHAQNYNYAGVKCSPENAECVLAMTPCAQLCYNVSGTYTCSCNIGYTLDADSHTCNDIDECVLGTSGCAQLCNNTAGSYTCSCNTGYKLGADNQTCSDINECVLGTSACTQLCNNTVGSYKCSCNTGYTLAADNRTCNDINECVLGTSGCTQICSNTVGSYTCSCNTGYKLDANSRGCNDINECLNLEACSLQVCTNTNGSFICSCSPGYILSADMKTCAATLHAVDITLAGYTIDSFTPDTRSKFIITIQNILKSYCTNGRCSSQSTSIEYMVTIRSITNSAAGLVITLQVQTSSTVISATDIIQALTENNGSLVAVGFIVVSIEQYLEPISQWSGWALAGIIAVVVATSVVTVVFIVSVTLLFKCCCPKMLHKKPLKYKGGTGEEMTMDVLEHTIAIDNVCVATTQDQQGELRPLDINCEGYPTKETKITVYKIATTSTL